MKINSNNWLDKPRIICGIMTGTSLDGINCAIVKFYKDYNGTIKFELLDWSISDFSAEIKALFTEIIEEPVHIGRISDLHFLLSGLYAESIELIFEKAGMSITDLDAVGIHGQTVWHSPEPLYIGGYDVTSTYQIGSVPALAAILGVPVAGDFRSADIALGGQGAPLVPIFDFDFLSSKDKDVIALNIGGIANITILPAKADKSKIIAFDTGPGNVYIDKAMKLFFNKSYDNKGGTASNGALIDELFLKMKSIPFINKNPPKSTGREYFNRQLFDNLISSLTNDNAEDIIYTLTYFTAWSIAENIRNFGNPSSQLIIAGGGALNNYLVALLQKELQDLLISKSDEFGIPAEAKEALCFAYLSCLRIMEIPGNIPSVTGASRECVLGVLALP